MNVIVYQKPDLFINVIYSEENCLTCFNSRSGACSCVPLGVSFWIIDNSLLPVDRLTRDTWTLPSGVGDPSGTGINPDLPT